MVRHSSRTEADGNQRPSHLKKARGSFLLEVADMAALVEQHAEAFSAATGGRISLTTAAEMRSTAHEIAEIHARKPKNAERSSRALVDQALSLTAQVRAAVRYAGEGDYVMTEQAKKIARAEGRKSIADVVSSLGNHREVLEQHRDKLAQLMPDGIERIEAMVAAFDAHDAQRRARDDQRRDRTRELAQKTEHLQRLVQNIRALARIVLR